MLRKFLRHDRDYFNADYGDIQRRNAEMLRIACLLYSLILLIYTTITALDGRAPLLTRLYYIFDVFHLALCAYIFLIADKKEPSARRERICRFVFELTLLSFFIIEAVFALPNENSMYYPLPLIILVMIFIYSARQALAIILSYISIFAVLVTVFQSGEVRTDNLYLASATLIASLACYCISAKLRHDTSEAMGRLKYLCTTDSLTGLCNKQAFESLCRAYMEDKTSVRSYAMLFIDIDRFKMINDRFGHQTGDTVLKSVASVLKDTFYEKDYLCRFGGDEFVVFMSDCGSDANVNDRVEIFKAKVRALAKSLKIDELSCSVGVSLKSRLPETYSELLSRADAALYVEKKTDDSADGASVAERHFMQNAYTNSSAIVDFDASLALEGSAQAVQRTVLIADDNDMNREMLSRILGVSYKVVEAVNGKEAIDILDRDHETISAVMLDLIMPVMDGYEVLERMRSDSNLSKIPVLVTTVDTKEESEIRALLLGANDFIAKPYRPAIIAQRLENTINLRESAAMVNVTQRDELTGLYNKGFFYKKTESIIRANPDRKYDIVCSDIERFKLINELFGERTGDELLKYFANLLAKSVQNEGLCGRIGADSFAVLLPHREVYSKSDFENTLHLLNQFPIAININVANGVYVVDDVKLPVSTMCDRAMTACNSIKGKYNVHFAYYDDSFRQKALGDQYIIDSMKTALESGQFEVFYQPKNDLKTHSIVGAEALVRWRHPEKGIIPPCEFIPLFERNGFITDLDVYVWETVCRDMHDWRERLGITVPVSVNVSRTDIYNSNMLGILCMLIERYEIRPELLRLEITETAYMEDTGQLIETVNALRDFGFLIEMDDFGSGYSSLNILTELRVDVLKIDKSLVSESADERKKNVLRAITKLARQLDLPVIAEGVETESQVKSLCELGCDYAQGFFFARPMPKDDFEKRMRSVE